MAATSAMAIGKLLPRGPAATHGLVPSTSGRPAPATDIARGNSSQYIEAIHARGLGQRNYAARKSLKLRLTSNAAGSADASLPEDGGKKEESSPPRVFRPSHSRQPAVKVAEEKPVPPQVQRGQSRVLLQRLATQLKDVAVIGGLLAIWYASNIFYNIYNKQVLSAFPYATTCTFIHLLVASALMALCWVVKIKQPPVVNRRTVDSVFPLSILHLVGFLTTNMSLGAVNVSLTHTIKSLEPFFTVFLSYIFLGSVPTIPVMLTLVPIVAGVVIASATDLSFTWYGFATAMASNLAFQSRNVISKKYMVESSLESLEQSSAQSSILDEINLFACISIAAAVLMVPLVLALDGGALAALFASTSGDLGSRVASIMPGEVFWKTTLAGVCRTADVLSSYALLSRLNPVTHSVGNCVKRVVVIAVSIAFFGIKASYLNIVGTALALSGVFAYSMAKRMSKDRPDLRASLRATIKLQNFLNSLIPGFVSKYLDARAAKKAEAERAKAEPKPSSKGNDEPEYFL